MWIFKQKDGKYSVKEWVEAGKHSHADVLRADMSREQAECFVLKAFFKIK